MSNYETVFILNPVLSESQIEEAVKKYESLLKAQKCKIIHKDWGLKKLAFTIQNKIVDSTTLFSSKVMVRLLIPWR